MKKLLTILAAGLAATLLLASCRGGITTAEMTFNPVTGEGTKTLRVSVPKNDQAGVDNNFGEYGYVRDPQKLLEMLESNLPYGYDTKLEDIKEITYRPADNIKNAVALTAISTDSVTIEWKRPKDNEIGKLGGYIVERFAKTADTEYAPDGTYLINSPETLTYIDNDFDSAKTYKYNVTAVVDVNAAERQIIVRLDGAEVPGDGKAWELDGIQIESNPAKQGDTGSYDYIVSFTFKGIEDYNAKMKALITEEFWNTYNKEQKAAAEANQLEWTDILPAELTVDDSEEQTTYTFTEDVRVTDLFAQRMGKLCLEDTTGAWRDPVGLPIGYSDIATAVGGIFTLTMLDKTQAFEFDALDEYSMTVSVNKDRKTVDSKGGESEVSSSAEADEANPSTGDSGMIFILLAACVMAGFVVVLSRKVRI